MNHEEMKGNWKQISGLLKEKWGELTDDELKITEGKLEFLIGVVQTKYGHTKDEAFKQVNEFFNAIEEKTAESKKSDEEPNV